MGEYAEPDKVADRGRSRARAVRPSRLEAHRGPTLRDLRGRTSVSWSGVVSSRLLQGSKAVLSEGLYVSEISFEMQIEDQFMSPS